MTVLPPLLFLACLSLAICGLRLSERLLAFLDHFEAVEDES